MPLGSGHCYSYRWSWSQRSDQSRGLSAWPRVSARRWRWPSGGLPRKRLEALEGRAALTSRLLEEQSGANSVDRSALSSQPVAPPHPGPSRVLVSLWKLPRAPQEACPPSVFSCGIRLLPWSSHWANPPLPCSTCPLPASSRWPWHPAQGSERKDPWSPAGSRRPAHTPAEAEAGRAVGLRGL